MIGIPILSIEELRTYFYSRGKQVFIRSVDNVSLRIKKGETPGIVGESGSGTSALDVSFRLGWSTFLRICRKTLACLIFSYPTT